MFFECCHQVHAGSLLKQNPGSNALQVVLYSSHKMAVQLYCVLGPFAIQANVANYSVSNYPTYGICVSFTHVGSASEV